MTGSLLGIASKNCPEDNCNKPCYEPCKHTHEVVERISSPLLGRDPLLQDYIYGSLEQQEKFLQAMCQTEPSDCQIGEWLGFPCVQCVPKDCCCGSPDCIWGGCAGLFTPVIAEDQTEFEFNFMQSAEGVALYSQIITALKSALVNSASVKSVETVMKMIWPDSSVARFDNSTMFLCLGRDPTPMEISIKNIIAKALPIPLGVCIQFMQCEI